MASVNDVVALTEGSIGVIGEITPDGYRAYFDESHLDIADADISSTLSAPVFEVGDQVSVWPNLGSITAIDGDQFTVAVQMQESFDFGPITWTGAQKVPRWRIIRDNDPRIERIW